jgi:thiol-disulfide isomerase/thioredoxin
MNMVDSNVVIEKLINNNEMVLIYFGSESCGVCGVMKPKVEEILKNYPSIKNIEVNVEKSKKIAALYNIFTIPGILVYIEGKEIIREVRHISLQDINSKIERYYNMLFE